MRLELLVPGFLTGLGRRTISQLIVTLGGGDQNRAAWYRLFSLPRITKDVLQRQVLTALVTLLSRCAKNRALFALPGPRPEGPQGRRHQYGERLPTPQQVLQDPDDWQPVPVMVRRRQGRLRVTVTGPCLVKPAPDLPLFLLVVRGVAASRSHRRPPPSPTPDRPPCGPSWRCPGLCRRSPAAPCRYCGSTT